MARQAQVGFQVSHELAGTTCSADRHRLEQVLLNLVLNALRATPAGGCVEIRGAKTADSRAGLISITDSGRGIAPADLERIFEPGFSTREGSPGLGLTVCRRIIEQHGGSLAASNRDGGGAMLTVTLPLQSDPRKAENAA
jgi:two-component system, NtrC family, nitrogen regulation sensor histidine kinase NtrY